jgi:hypothetical protein
LREGEVYGRNSYQEASKEFGLNYNQFAVTGQSFNSSSSKWCGFVSLFAVIALVVLGQCDVTGNLRDI